MINDNLTKLADGQAFSAGTTYSTYCYDTANVTPNRQAGEGEPMCLVFSIGTAANIGGTDTTSLAATSSTSATDGSTAALELASAVIANAKLTLGSRHVIVIPPSANVQRYIYGRVVLGGGDSLTCDIDMVPLSFVGKGETYADAVTWT